jgi:chromate transporter
MHDLSPLQLLNLFGHFLGLSLLAIGGAIATAPDMNRYLVREEGWLTDGQFTDAIALAQAAPGPNVLFVAVMGWNVAGAWGVLATMLGMLLPSTVLSLWASRWQGLHKERRAVLAFTTGFSPLTIGLLLASSWVLAEPALAALLQPHHAGFSRSLVSLAVMGLTVTALLKTSMGPIVLVALGAVVGGLGWV